MELELLLDESFSSGGASGGGSSNEPGGGRGGASHFTFETDEPNVFLVGLVSF